MAELDHGIQPQLPLAISAIEDRYMIFDIEAITWLRKNVFMGLPMEIMPEEAQVLINTGIGYILEDAKAHDVAMARANQARQRQYTAGATEQADAIAREKALEKQHESKLARERQAKKKSKQQERADNIGKPENDATPSPRPAAEPAPSTDTDDTTDSLFDSTTTLTPSTTLQPHTLTITPTTSTSLLPPPDDDQNQHQPPPFLPNQTPKSFSLYNHLHTLPGRTYFMTPGLRFGCQFCVYPGDPLRFHSHFLATGVDWDEEIDLMDIVGGGRLGTGVKKGYLFGGKSPGREGGMRVFSVEWAAM